MTAHLGSMHSAIKMLISRVALLHQMLLKMQSGEGSSGEGRWHWGSAVWSTCTWQQGQQQGSRGSSCGSQCALRHALSPEPVPRMISWPLHPVASTGEVPFDHGLVRQAAALTKRLPAVDSPQFASDYSTVRAACCPALCRFRSLPVALPIGQQGGGKLACTVLCIYFPSQEHKDALLTILSFHRFLSRVLPNPTPCQMQEHNDTLLTILLAALTKGTAACNEIVDKVRAGVDCCWHCHGMELGGLC